VRQVIRLERDEVVLDQLRCTLRTADCAAGALPPGILISINAAGARNSRNAVMYIQKLAASERAVPRYTSYPTAPHFGPAVNGQTYGAWLESLPGSAALSFYLHVPFCQQLCHYCGCNTKAVRQAAPVDAYAAVLSREIELVAARTGCRGISHLHWGGGTPSILGPDRLRALVGALDAGSI